MISEQVTDIQGMRKSYFQTGEVKFWGTSGKMKSSLLPLIPPSIAIAVLVCPFSNKLYWFQVHSVQSKLFHLFHSNSAEQLALVEYANVFYSPVLLWLLLPAGPVSPHTHHLGSLVPKPWTKGHHIWCFLSFFFGEDRKTSTQWLRTLVTKIKINPVIVFVAPLYHFTSIPVEESEQKGRLQRDHSRLWNRWNLSREKTPGLGGQASLDRLTRQWQWQSPWQGQG